MQELELVIRSHHIGSPRLYPSQRVKIPEKYVLYMPPTRAPTCWGSWGGGRDGAGCAAGLHGHGFGRAYAFEKYGLRARRLAKRPGGWRYTNNPTAQTHAVSGPGRSSWSPARGVPRLGIDPSGVGPAAVGLSY